MSKTTLIENEEFTLEELVEISALQFVSEMYNNAELTKEDVEFMRNNLNALTYALDVLKR